MKQKIIFAIFFLSVLSFSIFISGIECTDSDFGRNYFEKGITTNVPPTYKSSWTDECLDDTILQEGTCEVGLGVHTYSCANGCMDGVCIKGEKKEKCIDSDGGKNYYSRGETFGSVRRVEGGVMDYQITYDICVKDNQIPQQGKEEGLFESFCDEEGYLEVTDSDSTYICPFGCEDGKCLGTEKVVGVIDKPVEIPEIDQINRIVYVCEYCQKDNQCFPFGYIENKEYCSENGFYPQLSSGYSCKNNYECNSNLCLDNVCVQSNIFSKSFRWLKNLFG